MKKISKKLNKNYGGELPSFLKRLDGEKISEHPCFNCLRETELAVDKGYWKKYRAPIRYWYEMCDAESKELKKIINKTKPKTVLEIGCGSGRIINILLHGSCPAEIFAVDKDLKIINIIKPHFEKFKNVHIINRDILEFLKEKKKFDLSLSMMNTLGNIDNQNILKSIASHSKNLVFTVYDKKYYKLRKEIYASKGHKGFTIENETYYFNDCWVKGLKSKSYTKEELKEMCKSTGKKFKIKKISKLLFMAHIYD